MPLKPLPWRKGVTGEGAPEKQQGTPRIGAISTPLNGRAGDVEEGDLLIAPGTCQQPRGSEE